jgi:hypothetical protein
MEKISEETLKKTILAVEGERLKNPPAFRPDQHKADVVRRAGKQRHALPSGMPTSTFGSAGRTM